MEIISNKACFTIDNCSFMGIENFRKKFENSERLKELTKDISELNIIVKVNGLEIKDTNQIPLIVYGNQKLQIRYDDLNEQISIDTNDYGSQKELMKELLQVLCQFKIQDTTSISFKFLKDCDNGKDKLQIFTQNINDFPNWSYNDGFEVVIPIQAPETGYTETYKISKVKGGDNGGNFENYVYRVVGNYKYKIDENEVDLQARIKLIDEIIGNIANIYANFSNVCTKTMEL